MNLILQALHEISAEHIEHISSLTSASQAEKINTFTWRLHKVQENEGLEAYCFEHEIDYGFIPAARKITDYKLIAMDMDSTLITIECIDEVADMNDLKPQVSEITQATMRGEINFAESLRRRAALLKGLDESVLEQVYNERVKLSLGAEHMLNEAKKHGIKTLLISGGFVNFAHRLQKKLALDYAYANTLEIVDGKITGNVLGDIIGAQGKADKLLQTCNELGIKPSQTIAMGDGANDLKMMAQAGISIAFRAKPIVRAQASYSLNFVGLDGLLPLIGAE